MEIPVRLACLVVAQTETSPSAPPGSLAPVVILVVLIILIGLFLFLVPFGLWIRARSAGVRITIGSMVGMRLRRVPLGPILNLVIAARQAGLTSVTPEALERHYLATDRDLPRVAGVVQAMMDARASGGEMTWEEAAAGDLQSERR